MDFYHFFSFFWNLLLRVEWERNGSAIFIFSIPRPFPTYFCLELIHSGIFLFFNFFFSFFGIFYYLSGKNGSERQFLFFLFLGLFQSILAWNEAITVSFNFLNFFAIFSEFSIALWVGTKRNDNFYFLFSLAFSNMFCLEMTP